MADERIEKQKVKELTDKLEQRLKELFESEKYKSYLTTMSKVHNYSFNNALLIAMQKPEATLFAISVAYYTKCKNIEYIQEEYNFYIIIADKKYEEVQYAISKANWHYNTWHSIVGAYCFRNMGICSSVYSTWKIGKTVDG